MYFYACFAVALIFSRNIGLICALALTLIGLSIQFLGYSHVALSTITNTLVIEFLMGVLASIVYLHIYDNKAKLGAVLSRKTLNIIGCFCLLFLVIYWSVLYRYFAELQLARFILWGIPSVLLLITFISFEPLIHNWKTGVLVGDISYSLYLIQVFTLPIVIKLAMLTSINSIIFIICVGFLQYSFSLVSAFYSYKLIEIPVTRYLNQKFG